MLYNECCEPTDIIFCSKTLRQPKDVSFWHQIQAHICYIRCLQIHFKGTGRLFWTLIGFKVCCPSCVCFLPLSYVCPLLSHNKTLFQIFRWAYHLHWHLPVKNAVSYIKKKVKCTQHEPKYQSATEFLPIMYVHTFRSKRIVVWWDRQRSHVGLQQYLSTQIPSVSTCLLLSGWFCRNVAPVLPFHH